MVKIEELDANNMGNLIRLCLDWDRPRMLRALSFSFIPFQPPKGGNILLRAHFFVNPTEDDLEKLSLVETELYSHIPWVSDKGPSFNFTTEVQVAPIGSKIYPREYIAWIDPMETRRKP